MEIELKLSKDFERFLTELKAKYGEEFEYINGLHPSQLDFSEFIDNFVDKDTVADASIDPNANANHKDIRSFMTEKAKSEDKLFALNKIFMTIKKQWGLRTAKQWLEQEFSKGFYLNDSTTSSFFPYCFTGDTEIMTRKGVKKLQDLVGANIQVLNKYHGWENATVEHFGVQPIRKLTLVRNNNKKEIFVTGNHKWFVKTKDGKIELSTDELNPGMKIPYNTSKTWINVNPSPFGVAHGFFMGDGDKGAHRRVNFCGDKDSLIPYFTPANITGTEKEKTVYGVPKYFCDYPSLDEDANYLYGWLSGYFAADGCIDVHGRCTISSTKLETMEFIQNVLCVLGMPVNEIKHQDRVSNLTNKESRVYYMAISRSCLTDDFFIRPTHIENWKKNKFNKTKEKSWIVESVEQTDRVEDVYCAVAEYSGSFTLANNVLTHNCWANDLTRLATEGLFFLGNYNHQAPKHLTTYFDDVIEFVSFLSNRQSGAVGLPNVLVWAWYFWKKDVEGGYYMKDPDYYARQQFQKFIYRLNQPFLRIDQSAFTNVSIFDHPYMESLFGGVEFPDGTLAIDYIDDLVEFQKVFMDVVSEIREENMFTYPVLTYSLLKKPGITKEQLDEMMRTKEWDIFADETFARWCSNHNIKWSDSNFFCNENVGVLSNCCRLLSDTTKLNAFINSIGGTALSVGSCRVSTVNLMRIAYESNRDKEKYLEILGERVLLDCKALASMRHIIKRNIEKGLLPNYADGAVELDKQFCTIGGIGMFEVMDYFGLIQEDEIGNKSYSDEAVEFATQILDKMNEVKDNFECDFSLNIEMIPAENCAGVMCTADNLLYEQNKYFIYSNQWIPLMEKCTIQEKCRLGSLFDEKCGGGCIAHIDIESRFANEETAWDMLNYVAAMGVIYFAFTTKISVCKNKHAFIGSSTCPNCGNPIADTYARVVGFYTPVSSYQKIRKQEFNKRKWYDVLTKNEVMK